MDVRARVWTDGCPSVNDQLLPVSSNGPASPCCSRHHSPMALLWTVGINITRVLGGPSSRSTFPAFLWSSLRCGKSAIKIQQACIFGLTGAGPSHPGAQTLTHQSFQKVRPRARHGQGPAYTVPMWPKAYSLLQGSRLPSPGINSPDEACAPKRQGWA